MNVKIIHSFFTFWVGQQLWELHKLYMYFDLQWSSAIASVCPSISNKPKLQHNHHFYIINLIQTWHNKKWLSDSKELC